MSRLACLTFAALCLVLGAVTAVSAEQRFELWQDAGGELLLINVGEPDANNARAQVAALEFSTPPEVNLRLDNYRTLQGYSGGYFNIIKANQHFLSEASATNVIAIEADEKKDFLRVGRLLDLADADRDNDADLNDFGLLKDSFGKAGVGDFNGDATTDFTDFGILRSQFGVPFDQLLTVRVTLPPTAGTLSLSYPATFGHPDWIADGLSTPPDGVLPTSSIAAPEPSTGLLTLAGLVGYLAGSCARRRRG